MRAPIVSRKHYVQQTITQVTTGTVTSLEPIRAAETSTVNDPAEIIEGHVVKAIFVEIWVIGTFNLSSFVVMVEKAPALATDPSFSEMALLDSYDNKKNILFASQGLMAEDNQNPTPVLRQWIKIPKGKQRFGLRDKLKIHLASLTADDLQFCGFQTYKSYS